MNKKLYRDEYHKVIGGVCSGLAEYFEMDVTIVRLLFAFTFFIMGVGFGTYIILWIVLPRKNYMYNNFYNPTVDYTVPPQQAEGQNTQPGTNFGSGQFGGNPFAGNPNRGFAYNNNPFTASPADLQPKPQSKAGIIVGAVLIVIGAFILIDNFDLFPDFDFDRLWPVILVVVGGILISSATKKQPWEKENWHTADAHTANPTTDNPPAAATAADEPGTTV